LWKKKKIIIIMCIDFCSWIDQKDNFSRFFIKWTNISECKQIVSSRWWNFYKCGEKKESMIIYSCVSFEYLDSESLYSYMSTDKNSTDDSSMVSNGYERNVKLSLWQKYSSLSSQHPIRFLGLCTQVFLYYLAYGYLQVSFSKIRQII
jgi:hypothetical protein